MVAAEKDSKVTAAEPKYGDLEEKAKGAASQDRIVDFFKVRPLPWWICFLGGVFLLTKFQLVYNDSPCAVLGTQSPVSMPDVKKAFRTLSMCTHPDRLRGRLKRQPTPAEARRGEIIFNRASVAKDELSKILRGKKKAKCYQGELEMAVVQGVQEVGNMLASLGIDDYKSFLWDSTVNMVTFQRGFIQTVLQCLWLAFIFRMVKQFGGWLWRMGIIRGSLAFVTTIVIGPLPTVYRFVALPFMRLAVFLQEIIAEFRPEVELPAAEAESSPDASAAKETPAQILAAKAANKDLPARVRQRKRKDTTEEKEKKNKELLTGGAENSSKGDQPAFGRQPVPEKTWDCISWSHREPVKARQAAAAACQFDLLLILTKPIIPLMMLVALGQVWNGLFSSLLVGHALRRWVPQMSYEAHHLLCAFFGTAHTLLGVSAQQVEDFASSTGANVLHLAWSWSFKDVLSVMHMSMLGATVMAMSNLGNEPSFAASFASGIAFRIAIAQDSIRGVGLVKSLATRLEDKMREMSVMFDSAEEAVAYSGNGIGDCGGGPFRMMFGDGQAAKWAAIILKIWLMLLPFLAMLQWFQRTLHASRNLGKKFKTTRFVQRLVLFILGLVQIIMIANVELNASNGALGNYWVAMLFGCAGESLFSTYDIRGPVRQMFFLLLFLLV
mmetsp:Transcript_62865/g.142078  ORF Transcript_62865/g.142078 Transcript_62865/m.142078 type:complete len:666 (+) Transcript_62865:165-2162(+)